MKNNDDLEKDLEKMSKKILNLNDKLLHKREEFSEDLDEAITSCKGELSNLSNKITDSAKTGKMEFYSDMMQSKMNYEVSKGRFQKKMAEKKFDNAVAKAEYLMNTKKEYAAFVADYAVWIAEEAHMAELESKKATKEFKKLTQK